MKCGDVSTLEPLSFPFMLELSSESCLYMLDAHQMLLRFLLSVVKYILKTSGGC